MAARQDARASAVTAAPPAKGAREQTVPLAVTVHPVREETVPSAVIAHPAREETVPSAVTAHPARAETAPSGATAHPVRALPPALTATIVTVVRPEAQGPVRQAASVPRDRVRRATGRGLPSDRDVPVHLLPTGPAQAAGPQAAAEALHLLTAAS